MLCAPARSFRAGPLQHGARRTVARPAVHCRGLPQDLASKLVTATIGDNAAAIGDLNAVPQEYLIAGGAALVLLLVGGAVMGSKDSSGAAAMPRAAGFARGKVPENAVLVFGATGGSGLQICRALLNSGRSVVMACRSSDKAKKAMSDLGISPGKQPSGSVLFIEGGIDVAQPRTITKKLFQGITQVVSAIGASGPPDKMTGTAVEDVEWKGAEAIVQGTKQHVPQKGACVERLFDHEAIRQWACSEGSSVSVGKMDGTSTAVAVWSGNLSAAEEFCTCALASRPAKDLSTFDGLMVWAAGSGGTYSVQVTTGSKADGLTFQAPFTPSSKLERIVLPWHMFLPVDPSSRELTEADGLDPSTITGIGFVRSGNDEGGEPLADVSTGPFELMVASVQASSEARPVLLFMSAACTERNARAQGDLTKRAADIPIVRLNPGGIVNWKYKAEIAVRNSGLPYVVLRSCGLVEKGKEDGMFCNLELSQGIEPPGQITRAEIGDLVAGAMASPLLCGKTFEARRATPNKAAVTPLSMLRRQFTRLTLDSERRMYGLPPFPKWFPPPPPLSPEDVGLLMQGKVPGEVQESVPEAPAAAAAATPKQEAPKEAAPKQEAPKAATPQQEAAAASASIAVRKAAVQAWIKDYRARSTGDKVVGKMVVEGGEKTVGKMSVANGAAQDAASPVVDVAAQKAEVQSWISSWRARTSNGVVVDAAAVKEPATNGAPKVASANGATEVQEWIANWRATQKL